MSELWANSGPNFRKCLQSSFGDFARSMNSKSAHQFFSTTCSGSSQMSLRGHVQLLQQWNRESHIVSLWLHTHCLYIYKASNQGCYFCLETSKLLFLIFILILSLWSVVICSPPTRAGNDISQTQSHVSMRPNSTSLLCFMKIKSSKDNVFLLRSAEDRLSFH